LRGSKGVGVTIKSYGKVESHGKKERRRIIIIIIITRGTAGRRSPALIHKWNNFTARYAGLIPPASPSF
jgi:hypothetical protein